MPKRKMKGSFRKKALTLLLTLNLALLTATLLYAFFTVRAWEAGEELIPCFYKNSLHFYCPGCGGSRAVVAILRLDFLAALTYSPAVVVAFVLIAYLDVLAILAIIKNEPKILARFNSNLLILIPTTILLNFAVRLILFFGFGIDVLGDLSV